MVSNIVPLEKMKDRVSQLKTVVIGGRRVAGAIGKVITEEWELFQEYIALRTRLNTEVKAVGSSLDKPWEIFKKAKATAKEMKAVLVKTEQRIAELKALEEKEKQYATLIRVITRYLDNKSRINVVDSHHEMVKSAHGDFIACEAEAIRIMQDAKLLKKEAYIELHNFLGVHIARLNAIIAAARIDGVKRPLAAINSKGLVNQFEKCENICVAEDKDMKQRFNELVRVVGVVGNTIDAAIKSLS